MWQLWYPADFPGRFFCSASPFLPPKCDFAAFPGSGVTANAGRGWVARSWSMVAARTAAEQLVHAHALRSSQAPARRGLFPLC